GLLTIPYVVYFPGVFHDPTAALAPQQVSVGLWLAWHLVFPIVIGGYRLYDPNFRKRFVTGARIHRGLQFALFCVIAGSAAVIWVVLAFDGRLPTLVENNHFTALWTHTLMP